MWLSGPRRIETSITVTRVGNIDTVLEQVDARLLIDAYWLPSSDELAGGGAVESGWQPEPNFQLTNAVEVRASTLLKPPYLKEREGGVVWHARLEVDATFKQQFDLRAFPFDRHIFRLPVEALSACHASEDPSRSGLPAPRPAARAPLRPCEVGDHAAGRRASTLRHRRPLRWARGEQGRWRVADEFRACRLAESRR